MEINVGEYVRTKDGIIKRVSSYNPQENNPLWETLNGNVQMKGTITKHSKDIIDIIEVGDYVNGYKIIEIGNSQPHGNTKILYFKERDKYLTAIFSADIKSILTHEQFEANAYILEKEK